MLVCKVAKRVGSSRVRSLHPPLPPREPQRASHYLLCGFAIKSLHSGHGESNSDCSRAHFVSNMPYNCGHSWQMMISLFLCMQGNAGLSSSLAVSPPLMSHQLEQGRPRRASKPPTPDWEKATRRDQPQQDRQTAYRLSVSFENCSNGAASSIPQFDVTQVFDDGLARQIARVFTLGLLGRGDEADEG